MDSNVNKYLKNAPYSRFPKKDKEIARILAEAYYELYYNNNEKKALDILAKKKEMIKEETSSLNKSLSDKFRAESIAISYDLLVTNLWLDSQDKSISHRAYKEFFEKPLPTKMK